MNIKKVVRRSSALNNDVEETHFPAINYLSENGFGMFSKRIKMKLKGLHDVLQHSHFGELRICFHKWLLTFSAYREVAFFPHKIMES